MRTPREDALPRSERLRLPALEVTKPESIAAALEASPVVTQARLSKCRIHRRSQVLLIGYDTVPSFRGRGVATEMLCQALPVARALGLTSVLLTCDDTNAASIRVIERNGGSLQATKALDTNRPLKRYYWISLSERRGE